MHHYDLDPANYFSSPGISWDALLKKTKINLELLTDIDMHLFMEKVLRGRLSMVSKRFGKANNPQCPNCNNLNHNNSLLYLNANNFYGWAMNQFLPVREFQRANPELFTIDDVLAIPDNAEYGYIKKVNI